MTLSPPRNARMAAAADYSWVTGELTYVHAGKGAWVVRYASLDTEDRFGGSMVLTTGVNVNRFREGDIVTVRGEVLDDGRPGGSLGGALYRPIDIKLEEREGR